MIKNFLLLGLIFAILLMPAHTSFGADREELELVIEPSGKTYVHSTVIADLLDSKFEIDLFGESVDNFVAIDNEGVTLQSEVVNNMAIIDVMNSTLITVNYEIHDLVSKEGRIWTFYLDSPINYSMLLPRNSIIVGMEALPLNMEIVAGQTRLELGIGLSEINYIFGVVSLPPTYEKPTDFPFIFLAIIPIAILAIVLIKKRQKNPTIPKEIADSSVSPEKIFELKPDIRDDDKLMIKFISENGGQVLESQLRKKFLQPRTTMWRAVKRLERYGIVEIIKKDQQNLVKLKKDLDQDT